MTTKPVSGTALGSAHLSHHQYPARSEWYQFASDGVTDDTTKMTEMANAVGSGGEMVIGPGTTIVNNWTPTQSHLTIRLEPGATLKAASGAAAVITFSATSRNRLTGGTIDGNSKASDGVRITGAANASSLHAIHGTTIQNCAVGLSILDGSPTNEADQNSVHDVYIFTCNTGLKNVATNGQNLVLENVRISTCTTAGLDIAGNCSLVWNSGQVVNYSTGILFSGTNGNGQYVELHDVLFESSTSGATDIDGSAHWPALGVELYGCVLQAGMSAGSGKTVSMKATSNLLAVHTAFENGDLTANFGNCYVEDRWCQFSSSATYTGSATTSKRISWSDAAGSGTQTITYYRGTAVLWQADLTNNKVAVGASSSSIGFYGVTPITRAVLATGAAHTVDDVITALQNLGLVKQS